MNKTECRSCSGKELLPVVDLGLSPLANNLLNSTQEIAESFPLKMVYCPNCHNCQLSYVVPSDKMFKHYLYVSSTSPTFRKHFKDAAEHYVDRFKLKSDSFIVDIGSNDGIALKPFKEKGYKVLGVEPADNIAEMALIGGIGTYNDYFDNHSANIIRTAHGRADLVLASNVFAHADNLDEITDAAFKLLKPNGTFIIEVQYLLDTIKDLTFDNIYHEHTNYWSLTSLYNFFTKLGYVIDDVENIPTHGGSIRVYVKNKKSFGKNMMSLKVSKTLELEKFVGLRNYQTYLDFGNRVKVVKNRTLETLESLKSEGKLIVGYGSPAKATTALNYYGVSRDLITYIIDDNPLKWGKVLPGINIPIFNSTKLLEETPDVVVVMAWNFFNEICATNKDLIRKGVEFISIKDL